MRVRRGCEGGGKSGFASCTIVCSAYSSIASSGSCTAGCWNASSAVAPWLRRSSFSPPLLAHYVIVSPAPPCHRISPCQGGSCRERCEGRQQLRRVLFWQVERVTRLSWCLLQVRNRRGRVRVAAASAIVHPFLFAPSLDVMILLTCNAAGQGHGQNSPCVFPPQAYARPSLDRTTVWYQPQETCWNRWPTQTSDGRVHWP